MPHKHAREPAKAALAQDDEADAESPQDIVALRQELAERLSRIVGNRGKRWRTCGEPSCRRARRCCPPQGSCSNRIKAQRQMTPEHKARHLARLHRAIGEISDRIEAQREAQSANESHKKS
jgi:hypothetical protein